MRQFLKQSFDLGLSRSSCLNYLHRLGFVLKRPKKRLLKAKDEERKAFIIQYSQIREEAERIGAKIFFVDEAHFRADADLRGKWVLKGEPALVDSTSPRWGEKACYYSGVCLESGEVEAMEIAGNSNAETSTAFLQQLRENHPGPLVVIWDNGPAHRGEAITSRRCLAAGRRGSTAVIISRPCWYSLGSGATLRTCRRRFRGQPEGCSGFSPILPGTMR